MPASPDQIIQAMSGVWIFCTTTGSPLGPEWLARDTRSYAFTSDGSWYALNVDPAGNLVSAPASGVDAGPGPYSGTYSFDDGAGNPLQSGEQATYVAAGGSAWFKPSFTSDGTGLLMMVVDGSENSFARVE